MSATPPALLLYLQEFQDKEIQAEGVLYPSPAARFGARDRGQSPVSRLSFSSISSDIIGSTVSSHFSTTGTSRHPNGPHPVGLPYFAHLDQQGHDSPREKRQPRRPALGEHDGTDRGGSHGFDSRVAPKVAEAGLLHSSTTRYGHGELTATDDGDTEIKDGVVTEQRRAHCGTVDGGGCAAEAPGVRSEISNLHPLHWQPPLERVQSPQIAKRGTYAKVERGRKSGRRWQGWLRHLPGVAQEMCSDGELGKGEADVVDEGNALSLSRLFAYAFPDNDQHTGLLLEPTREKDSHQRETLSGVDDGVRSMCSLKVKDAARTVMSSRRTLSSSPRVPPSSTIATTTNKKTLVGVTVRRPPSPQFYFMAQGSLDARTPPGTSPRQRAPQETSCVDISDQRASDVQQQQTVPSKGPFGTPLNYHDDAEIPTRLESIVDETARSGERSPLSADVDLVVSSSGSGRPVRPLLRSRKRRHPVSQAESVAVALRNSTSLPLAVDCLEGTVHKRPPSAGDHRASYFDTKGNFASKDGWLGQTCVRGRVRSGWWGAKGGSATSSGDEEALDVLRPFQMNGDVAEVGEHETSWDNANGRHPMIKRGAGGEAATARYKWARAVDSTRSEAPGTGSEDTDVACGLDASMPSAGGRKSTLAAACGDEVSHIEGDGSKGVGDRNKDRTRAAGAALAYDQDELGGDGLAQDGFVFSEPKTVADLVGQFMATEECNRSDEISLLQTLDGVNIVTKLVRVACFQETGNLLPNVAHPLNVF